ncbi:MAG: hypothetical protein D6812_07790, partial [Deltaproteobacteria bacterium]
FYRTKGYPFCTVTALLNEDATRKEILFQIEEGKRLRIETIDFIGNHTFDDGELQREMLTRPTFLGLGGILDEEVLAADRKAIVFFYEKHGFLDVKVEKPRIIPEGKGLRIEITIEEGVRTYYGGSHFEGNHAFSDEELRRIVPLTEGMPYDPFAAEAARDQIADLYLDQGYLTALVTVEARRAEGRIELHFTIEEGSRYEVGRFLIQGHHTVSRALIEKILRLDLKTLDPPVYRTDGVRRAKRDLLKTGLFRDVEIFPSPIPRRPHTLDLVVRVRERKGGDLHAGFDLDSERGLGTRLEIGHANVYEGRRLFFQTDVRIDLLTGNLIERGVGSVYEQPWLLGRPIDLRFHLFDRLAETPNFTSERFALTTQIDLSIEDIFLYLTRHRPRSRPVAFLLRGLSLSTNYTVGEDDIFRIEDVDLSAVRIEGIGEFRIGTITQTLLRDTRDDPFDPSEGSLLSLSVGWGDTPTFSQVALYRMTAD